jgi:hypothetical protein
MTLLVFSSIIFLVLYILKSEYSSGPSYSHLYLVKKSHQCNITGCIDNVNYKIKMEEKDGIIIFAYLVVLIGIIFPNLNQID